jgi:hypothetical protein
MRHSRRPAAPSRGVIRRALVLALGLAAILAAPASAASPYVARVKSPECSHTGGTNGFGRMAATAEFNELAKSGTNYFRSLASAQKRTNNGWISWGTTSKVRSAKFADDFVTHVWSYAWEYNFLESEVGATYRLKFVYEYWHQKDGPDTRLAKLTKYAPAC